MNAMYKLIRYCKKNSISENEAIKAIHNYFNQQGYTKTNWKNERFGFYADLRIKNSGASTISLVKTLVEKPKYEEIFKFFYPHLELNKVQEVHNLTKLLSDSRQRKALHRVLKLKGYKLIKPSRKGIKIRPFHLQESQDHCNV